MDRYEFWAFRHRPRLLKGEKIIFTMDGVPVAETVCHHIEKPGMSKCSQTNKYEDWWKVFWLNSSFKKYKTASLTYDAVQQHPDFPRIEELLNQVFPHLTGERRQQKATELMEQHIRNNEALKHKAAAPFVMYHGTREPFTRVDMRQGVQGVFWLTSDIDSLKKGERGASSTKVILRCLVTIKNPAGWNEYKKKNLGELKRDGFDGVILPDPNGSFDAIVFKPSQVKIVGQEEIAKTALAFNNSLLAARRPKYHTYTPDTRTFSDKFMNWFKGSKVVDSYGKPLIVWHGSPDARWLRETGIFQTFDEKYINHLSPEGKEKAVVSRAYFFAGDRSTASSYADPHRAFDYQGSEPGTFGFY